MNTSSAKLPARGNQTFGRRLIALVAAVNAFAFIVAATALMQSQQTYRQAAETNARNLAQVLELNVLATIDRIDGALYAVAEESLRQERSGISDPATMAAMLARQSERTPSILGLRMADATGQVTLMAGVQLDRTLFVGDRDYFERSRDNPSAGLIISSPVFGRVTNTWLVVLCRRLNHADGSFAGIAFAPVPLEQFSRSFGLLNLGTKGAVSLRDAELSVVARFPETVGDGNKAVGQKGVSQALRTMVAQSPQEGTYVAKAVIDNVERTLSYRKVGQYPLYVIVGLAADDYLEHWNWELLRALALFGLFTPLTFLAALWALRSWKDEEAALERASAMSARLNAVLGNTPIGLAIIGADRRIHEANSALAEIFGVDLSALAGGLTDQFYPSKDEFEALGKRAYPVMSAGGTYHDVVPMRRHDSCLFWSKMSGRLVDHENPDLGYVWVLEDISEQVTATEALRASEERFRALVDGIRDYSIILLSPEGVVQTWNRGAEAVMGHTADEAIGQSFQMFYAKDDVDAGLPLDTLAAARENGRAEIEGWHLRKDGTRFRAKVVLTALHNDSGEVRGFAKITCDVTERRRAEAEIRRLASYQQAILANTPIGIAIVDLNRTILHANDAFCRIYGRQGEQLGGQSAAILYGDPAQSREVGERAYPLVLTGGTFSDDVLMCRRDGTTIWVRLVAHLVDENQPELGVAWAAEDISALKELNESLMRSNADLERFAYVASHDLRQPLRMISSYIGLIKRRLQAEDDAELHEFLGYAIDGAQRMDRMIIDMLDYSRIGRQSTPFQDVDLSQAVKQALSSLSAGIAESGAEIVVETPLPTVTGSASEIERLFQNLIGNAIKFRAQGRPPSVTINCRDGGNEWIISIADNGIGIDPAMHGRLFALFSRLVSQQQYEGTGIGLAACRKIAEHHGGRIWVESARDQGSVFHVALSKQRN